MFFRLLISSLCLSGLLVLSSCEKEKPLNTTAPRSLNAKHLEELNWLVGKWEGESQGSKVETSFEWDKEQAFLLQTFKMAIEGETQVDGKQVIGWDPVKKTIRSWVFDADGSFGEGTWKKEGKSFVVEMSKVFPDGKLGSFLHSFTPIDKGYQWESTGRAIGGEILPNIGPVTLKKKGL